MAVKSGYSTKKRRKAAGNRGDDVRGCIERYLSDVVRQNVVSALSIAFIKCYQHLGYPKDYVSLFSRSVSEYLHDRYSCYRISPYLREIAMYIDRVFKALSSVFNYVYLINLELVTRLMIGTRDPRLPLEVSISWDPILNVPYIPSSALKGVARSYFEENNISVHGLVPRDIFGDTRFQGMTVFLDAYPVGCKGRSLVEPDVIAPHYIEVEDRVDEASASPRPIIFPTVAPKTLLSTIIAFRADSKPGYATINTILEKIMEALARGIGAKTRLGYGRARIYQA